ncbi:MAG: endo alpha-1,4 polygalactosaminidase [Janthinobacterium lividum]
MKSISSNLASSALTGGLLCCLLFTGCRSVFSDPAPISAAGRGFPSSSPWVSCYGSAANMGDLTKVAHTFRIINIDADPGGHNFTPKQITQLKVGGQNRILSYLDVGSMEASRTYWTHVPVGFTAGKDNKAAHLGTYEGYPDETWMDLGNAAYQHLIVDYVAPRLVAQGVDGFFLDNMELVEHGPHDKNGPCNAACRQGGLDLIRRLREKYPNLLIVMQNATSDVTRLGTTGGIAFPSLLDGISHEEVYAPHSDEQAQQELDSWRKMKISSGGREFWIGTEDYVGTCANIKGAKAVYAASRAHGYSPYATDASAGQQGICYWAF